MSCTENNLSQLKAADFKKNIGGKETALFILKNKKGSEVAITNYATASSQIDDRVNGVIVPLENEKCAAALADFAAHAVVADYDESVFKSEPSVTVNPDGTRLLLTAPRIKLPPGLIIIVK